MSLNTTYALVSACVRDKASLGQDILGFVVYFWSSLDDNSSAQNSTPPPQGRIDPQIDSDDQRSSDRLRFDPWQLSCAAFLLLPAFADFDRGAKCSIESTCRKAGSQWLKFQPALILLDYMAALIPMVFDH